MKTSRVISLFAVYFGYTARLVTPFIVAPMLARRLGPFEYGLAMLGLSTGQVVTILIEFGFTMYGARAVALSHDAEEQAAILGQISLAKIVLLLPGLFIGFLLGSFAPQLRAHPAVFFSALAVGLVNGFNLGWFYQGLGRMATTAVIDVVTSLVYAALSYVLVTNTGGALVLLGCQLAAYAASNTAVSVLTFRRQPRTKLLLQAAFKFISASTPLFLVRSAAMLSLNGSVILLAAMSSTREVAFYSVGERIVLVGMNAFGPLNQLLFPLIARATKTSGDKASKIVGYSLLVNFGLSLVLALTFNIFSSTIVGTLYGSKFSAAITSFAVLSWLAPLAALTQVLGSQVLIVRGRDRTVLLCVALGAAANVGVALLAVPFFGALGMSVARISGEALAATCMLVVASKYVLGGNRTRTSAVNAKSDNAVGFDDPIKNL